MILLNALNFSRPFTEPVLIFALILFIILFIPIILNKLKIPHLIGLIMTGALVGPHGFNILAHDSSIELFGTVGILYIMFLAGLEMGMDDFKKNSKKNFIFAFFSFSCPMILGILGSYYLLHFSLLSSVLLGSMLASHTLITYPLVSKLGISRNPAINVTIGGTIIVDTLALLILAGIARMATGTVNAIFWLQLGLSLLIFVSIIIFIFPIIARWFFRRFDDNISQYIFVLAMVFLGAFLAMLAGLESIIGAFFAGLTLNQLIPKRSPLMNRVEFVGNALFIPFFLIGVGMLFNYRSLVADQQTLIVAVTITIIAIIGKYLGAVATQKTLGYSIDQRRLIFGLSNSRAAATLAAVLVGYDLELLSINVLNGTIFMILITCTVASFATQSGGQRIARQSLSESSESFAEKENILIPINNPEMVSRLVDLSIFLKNPTGNNALYALNIIKNDAEDNQQQEKYARNILKLAADIAAATDNELTELLRYDTNISNAISSVVREHKITDIILGLHEQKSLSESFLGNLTEGVLSHCDATSFIYKAYQPISTLGRQLIFIPRYAEIEIGFSLWITKIWNLGLNTKTKLVFHATREVIAIINDIQLNHPINIECYEFDNWFRFEDITKTVKADDGMIIVMSRKAMASYHKIMDQIPSYLNNHLGASNFILIYPIQNMDNEMIDRNNPAINYPKLTALQSKLQELVRKRWVWKDKRNC